MIEIKIKVENENCIPVKVHDSDAGYDLKANGDYVIESGATMVIDTGCAVELPEDEDWIWEAQVRPRSGMSLKTSVRVANAPGTIDAHYRNNIGVILHNTGDNKFMVAKGDRIAQLVITKIPKTKLTVANTLSETDRGLNGFGSSGIK